MNDKMKLMLSKLVEDEGVNGAIGALAAALSEYADKMSDMGLKDQALEAADIAGILRDINVE